MKFLTAYSTNQIHGFGINFEIHIHDFTDFFFKCLKKGVGFFSLHRSGNLKRIQIKKMFEHQWTLLIVDILHIHLQLIHLSKLLLQIHLFFPLEPICAIESFEKFPLLQLPRDEAFFDKFE